ncbi:hypothetical protein D3C76_1199340 [compost metagenome]
MKRPTGDDDIKTQDEERRDDLQQSEAAKHFGTAGFDKRRGRTASAGPPDGELSQKQRQSDQDQTDDEQQEEGCPSVFSRNIRELPHVAEAHGAADGGQDKSG